MPITFEQPGAYDRRISEDFGSAQALKDFAPFLRNAYAGGGGGGGDYGGGRGGGVRGLPGDAGGGGGAAGGGGHDQIDPLALYQGKQEVDRYFAKQDQDAAIAAIEGNTAEAGPSADEVENSQEGGVNTSAFDPEAYREGPATQAGQGADYNLENEDKPYGGFATDPSADVQNPDGSVSANSGNWRGGQAQPLPGQPGAQEVAPEFTQSDQLQLQRLQAAKARVQAQLQSGMVDPGTARRMIQQIQMGVAPLRAAQAAAQQQALQQQTQQEQQQNARRTAMLSMDAAHLAEHNRNHIFMTPGGHEVYISPVDGKPLNLGNPRAAAADRSQENAAQLRQHDDAEDERFRTHLEHAIKEERGATAAGETRPLTDDQKKRVRERMLQQGFTSDDLAEHRSNREDRRATSRVASEVRRRMDLEAAAPNPPAWARAPEARQDEEWSRTQARLREQGVRSAAPAPAPIPDNVTRDRLPPEQQNVMGVFDDLHRRLRQAGSGEQRNSFYRAESLYREYGGRDAMPPAQRRFFDRTMNGFQQLLEAPKPPSRRNLRDAGLYPVW